MISARACVDALGPPPTEMRESGLAGWVAVREWKVGKYGMVDVFWCGRSGVGGCVVRLVGEFY